MLEGGCLCGAVRYRVGGKTRVTHCHCLHCRKLGGAPYVTWVEAERRVAPAAFADTSVQVYLSPKGDAKCAAAAEPAPKVMPSPFVSATPPCAAPSATRPCATADRPAKAAG